MRQLSKAIKADDFERVYELAMKSGDKDLRAMARIAKLSKEVFGDFERSNAAQSGADSAQTGTT